MHGWKKGTRYRGKHFCDFYPFLTKNDKREERGRDQGEDAWSVKYKSIELCHPQRTKSCRKLKCFQVKL